MIAKIPQFLPLSPLYKMIEEERNKLVGREKNYNEAEGCRRDKEQKSVEETLELTIKAKNSSSDPGIVFVFLLLSNAFMYFECGTVPAMLLEISSSFKLDVASEGLMGGIVYLSLCFGGPIAAYCLRQFHDFQNKVIMYAVCGNTILTLVWGLTPVGYDWSSALFISLRFIMGLHQSIICVFLPIWVNEYAPQDQKATW